jgi:hypothetical protein
VGDPCARMHVVEPREHLIPKELHVEKRGVFAVLSMFILN